MARLTRRCTGVCKTCVQPRRRHRPTDRATPSCANADASRRRSLSRRASLPSFLYHRISLSLSLFPLFIVLLPSLSLFPSFFPSLVHRGRCSFTAINLPPRRRRLPLLPPGTSSRRSSSSASRVHFPSLPLFNVLFLSPFLSISID